MALEGRFVRDASGVYSHHLTYDRVWRRYAEVFDQVCVFARVHQGSKAPTGWGRADVDRVRFIDVRNWAGVRGFAAALRSAAAQAKHAALECDAAVLRVPGLTAAVLWQAMLRARKPYGLEVVGSPRAVLYTAYPFPVRLLAYLIDRWLLAGQLRYAQGVLWVTAGVLQAHARCRIAELTASVSDVELPSGAFVDVTTISDRAQEWSAVRAQSHRPWRLCFVGSLMQPYKGLETLLNAVRICLDKGLSLELCVVGEGRLRSQYEAMARRLGLDSKVTFVGLVPAGGPVMALLDRADLFVLPSRTEGLPRSLLEAMARGLPCIATPVGGVPELLPPEVLFPPGQAGLLAERILALLADPQRMAKAAEANLAEARQYSANVLGPRRQQFYTALRARFEEKAGVSRQTFLS